MAEAWRALAILGKETDSVPSIYMAPHNLQTRPLAGDLIVPWNTVTSENEHIS